MAEPYEANLFFETSQQPGDFGGEILRVSPISERIERALQERLDARWGGQAGLRKTSAICLGADPTGRVSRLFGVDDDGTGLALRGTFIIKPDGKFTSIIAWREW